MSPKQWLALFTFYISYLVFGASVFHHIEHDLELWRMAKEVTAREDINAILTQNLKENLSREQQDGLLIKVGEYCGRPLTNYEGDRDKLPPTWNFYHAFFFSFTVCSTVGYGNISPSSTLGRMFMIFYALIGIPVNGFLFAYLGDFFGKVFITAHERYKAYKMATNKNYMPHQLGLIAQIILYLIPGMVIFLFLPSLIFSYFEGWSYSEAIYYSFVTLSTIGFGDFVPTFGADQAEQFGFMFYVYEIFIVFWFIFGLGYLVMIMGFIAKGLRSKHLTRLEHQLSENIKATQSRIWSGVTKDVSYLRRILNEVYMMKFKGTYSDDADPEDNRSYRRTSSCPDLSIYRPSTEPMRKRAQSLFPTADSDPDILLNASRLHRVQSDGDLDKADRKKSFDETWQPTELLARVFTALGNIKAADDAHSIAEMGGINGFSDSQILSTEKPHGSRWSIPFSESSYSQPPTKMRGRAASDFRAPITEQLEVGNSHDWTWCGNNPQIEEYMRLRKLNKKKSTDLYRTALALPKPDKDSVVVNVEEAISPVTSPTRTIFDRLNPFRKRDDSRKLSTSDHLDVNSYLDQTTAGRGSRMSLSPYLGVTPAMKRRGSTFSMLSAKTDANSSEVLENTTIADLIRALEVMHTQAVTGDGPLTGDGLLEHFLETPRPRPRFASVPVAPNSPHDLSSQHPLPMINIFPPSTPTQVRHRRNSLRPTTTSNTPIFNRTSRRQSTIVDLPSARRSSVLVPPSTGPPPYSETPRPSHRRFSVRPTLLSIPPGQSPLPSIQATSSLQKRLSMRPSPLLNDNTNLSVRPNRFGRSVSAGSSNHSASPMETSPIPIHSLFLSTVNEANSQHNRQRTRQHPFLNTNTNLNASRRRTESEK